MLALKHNQDTGNQPVRSAANSAVRTKKATWPAHANPAKPDAKLLSQQLYQISSSALDGPVGIQPENLVASLGALAGHCARWMVESAIVSGKARDDFSKPTHCTRAEIKVSAKVDAHISDMTGKSFAAHFVPQMIGAGANWLPEVNKMIMHNFMSINKPAYPDYTVPEKHFPQLPPQTLLMMLWEPTLNCLRSAPDVETIAMQAFAMAAADAAKVNTKRLPLDIAGQLTLETAIAMSKVDYGF